jgi:hypothetical protein
VAQLLRSLLSHHHGCARMLVAQMHLLRESVGGCVVSSRCHCMWQRVFLWTSLLLLLLCPERHFRQPKASAVCATQNFSISVTSGEGGVVHRSGSSDRSGVVAMRNRRYFLGQNSEPEFHCCQSYVAAFCGWQYLAKNLLNKRRFLLLCVRRARRSPPVTNDQHPL